MQSWQIKLLELEAAALKHLDGFTSMTTLCFHRAIYLLLALVVWVLTGGLRRRFKLPQCSSAPVIVIQSPEPPREPDDCVLFPPPHQWQECDCHDEWD